jgi:hypothetical protein
MLRSLALVFAITLAPVAVQADAPAARDIAIARLVAAAGLQIAEAQSQCRAKCEQLRAGCTGSQCRAAYAACIAGCR